MSSFKFPSERSGSYNPKYYEDSGASGDVTQAELDTKANRSNDTLINPTLQNANFIGSVSGVLSSNATKLAILDANKTVGSEYTVSDQDFPAFNSNVLAYYDFSSRTQPGRDFSGNGRHASVLGGSLVTADSTTRTDVLQLTGEYRNTVHSSLISAFPAGMELDAFAPTIQRSTFSTSFWIKWSPFAGDLSLPMMVWSICRPETGATELPGYTPSNMAWCWIRGGSMVFSTFVGGVQTYQQGFGLTPNTWTHVAITTTPGTNQTKFYKNGVLQSTVGTIDVTSIGTATSFTIGCARASDQLPNSANGRQYCNNLQGELSDLMFTSSVLSEQDIGRLYADDYGMSIFPLCGQSNMTGQTTAFPDDSDSSLVAGKVFAYGLDSKVLTPAANPLPNTGSGAGLWLQFCRDFVQNTSFPRKRKVMVIQCAVGGSAMANWVPSTVYYNRAVLAMTEAVALNSFNKINGFLWNQGEAEMSNFNLGYKAQLLSMIAGFVSSVPTFSTSTPKVMCEISSASYARFVCPDPVTHMLSHMRSEMLSVVSADDTWAYVRSNDLSFTREGSYAVHYDSPSLKVLGGRYYDSLLQITGVPNTKPVAGRVWQAIKTLQTTTSQVVTKASLGMGNVDNTSDAGKPISDLTQAALDAKTSKTYVDTKVSDLVNAAPATLDTLNELAAALGNDPNFATTVSTLIGQKAPLASPTFTGTVAGVTKSMVGLGSVDNTSDAGKPVSTLTQSALDAKLPKNNGVVTGFMNFLNAAGQTISTFGHASIFGAIAANLSNGYGELGFVNNTGFSTLGWHAFSWYRYTSTTEKTVLASLTYGGTFNVPGTITGPTISDLNAADIALQGRALLLEDGVSLLGARVGILEAGSGAPTFQKLTQGSTTVETNASLKNVYFLTMSANSNTTLTFPDLVPGDSKYSGFSIKVRVRSGSATKTLTLTCPASPSAFVPMAAGRYNSKVFNALDSYVEYVTAEGDYVELVSTAVN